MMSVLQNAFANSCSSLIQSKITGNLVFVLLAAAVALGLVPGLCRRVDGARARGRRRRVPGDGLVRAAAPRGARRGSSLFALAGSVLMGTLGLIAGIWADKFDQLAAFQNFLIVPLTFLSGVFYSIHSLPPFWQAVAPEPVLLHDRRLPLRLLRASRRLAVVSLAVVGCSLVVVCSCACAAARGCKLGYKRRGTDGSRTASALPPRRNPCTARRSTRYHSGMTIRLPPTSSASSRPGSPASTSRSTATAAISSRPSSSRRVRRHQPRRAPPARLRARSATACARRSTRCR